LIDFLKQVQGALQDFHFFVDRIEISNNNDNDPHVLIATAAACKNLAEKECHHIIVGISGVAEAAKKF